MDLVKLDAQSVQDMGHHLLSVATEKAQEIVEQVSQVELTWELVGGFTAVTFLITLLFSAWYFTRKRPVYLVDFWVVRPPDRMTVSHEQIMQGCRNTEAYTEQSLDFMEKVLQRSGLGPETYLPDEVRAGVERKVKTTMAGARKESELVMFEAFAKLLEQQKLKPSQIDGLIVNCSLFNPTPSMSAMVVNHFKLRQNIVSYNLAGMGCSAGLIAVSLASELLQAHPNFRIVVISTENITANLYQGNSRSMIVTNALFRVGGAALLLTNRAADRPRAKYQLQHLVRTHLGGQDKAYGCVFQQEDDIGIVGVKLAKELMSVAGNALRTNITTLGPLVLPFSEQAKFAVDMILRKIGARNSKPYVPNFKKAFDHFLIHPGGRGVIEEIEKQLSLEEKHAKPSKDTLYHFGNTSSSSTWYVLANIESKKGVRKGEKVWQISFGSGFKCNSAVWKALRTNTTKHQAWEGKEGCPPGFDPASH
eukprot:jgi/Botrbrau1/20860/Bobra.0654s0001.1